MDAGTKMKNLVFIPFIILVIACSSNQTTNDREIIPSGQFLASIKRTLDSDYEQIPDPDGFLFYFEKRSNTNGPVINGYRMIDGVIVEEFSGTNNDYNNLRNIDLDFFLFQETLENSLMKLTGVKREDTFYQRPITLDGWGFEVKILTDHGVIEFEDMDLEYFLDHLEPHSEEFSKLKKYLDTLSKIIGKRYLYSQFSSR